MKTRHINIRKLDNYRLAELFSQTGDSSYAAELYDRHLPLIYGMCLNRTGSPEESVVKARIFFEKFTSELNRTNGEIPDLGQFLYETLDAYLPVDAAPSFMLTPRATELAEHIDASEDEAHAVLEELSVKLTRSQSACIHGFFIEKLSFVQIAEKGGFLLSDIREHIVRGMNICAESSKP